MYVEADKKRPLLYILLYYMPTGDFTPRRPVQSRMYIYPYMWRTGRYIYVCVLQAEHVRFDEVHVCIYVAIGEARTNLNAETCSPLMDFDLF